MGSQHSTYYVITRSDTVMELTVSLLTLLTSLTPATTQAPFSPLSFLGNIITSVHRARRFQGIGGRFDSLLRPHHLKSKFTSDNSFGVNNVYPNIVRFPYPQPIIQDFNYPPDFVKPSAFNIVQDTEEEVSTETSVTEDILEILTESSIISSNIEEEKTIGTIKPVRKIRKVKKSLRLSPNPQYAVEEFSYVPADNNEINYDQEDNEIDSIGNNRNIPSLNNTKEPVFIENFENLRNIT